MQIRRRQFLSLAAGAASLAALPHRANAQAWPSRSITMVVPVPAGGAMDTNARLVAEGMRTALGQPVVIENVTGAAGSVGTGRIARAAPDGYSILYGANVTHVLNPAVLTLNYDVVNDFEPIALIGNTPWLFAVKNDLPVKDLRELVAWLKANPDKATFGTAGVGSPSHIGGVLFQNITGTRFQFVPYRGTAPVIPDLVSGQIDMAILDPITSLPQSRGGKMKILAAMSKRRSTGAPDIPTSEEAGVPGVQVDPWQGMWAPKGTPRQVIAKVTDAVVKAFADPVVISRLTELGQDLPLREQLTPQALAAFHKAEIDKWWPLIKAANIKVE